MSRARDAKRQRRLLARRQEADMVQQATAQVEALQEEMGRARRAAWLRSPHPFWPKRIKRMAGK